MSTTTTAVLSALAVAIAVTVSSVASASAAPPMGAQIFCINHPGECRGGGASEVRMTEELAHLLTSVNARVNATVRYRPDRGVLDDWSVGRSSGDCEDYALTKRRRLIDVGVPASALRIAAGVTTSGVPHAALLIVTDRGRYLLDNRYDEVRLVSESPFRVTNVSTTTLDRWTH